MTMKKVEHVHATYDTPHLNAAVGVFALLANPVSVKMILAIRDIEVSANHLADIVDLPVDQTSHELHRLESAGIVSRQRRESGDFYLLNGVPAGALAEATSSMPNISSRNALVRVLPPRTRDRTDRGGIMPRFSRLTPETAVGASRDLLGDLVERHGQVGDMVSTMAHSPAVLGGYLQLSKAMRRAKLDRKVSELVSIAVQSKQGCGMCLASHISAARSLGVSDDEIALAQQGTAMTGPVAAMIALGLQVYRDPTSITDEQIDELRGYGYSDREISDVVGVVSLNILTGAFNLVAGLTPGD